MTKLNTPRNKGSGSASHWVDRGQGDSGCSANGNRNNHLLAEWVDETLCGKKLDATHIIGCFIWIGLVATGGMGELYAAYAEVLGRKVVSKLVRATIASKADFRPLCEVKHLVKLWRPNLDSDQVRVRHGRGNWSRVPAMSRSQIGATTCLH